MINNIFIELNQEEMNETDGGKGVLAWDIFKYVNDHWESWADAFWDGWNDYKY